MFMRPLLFALAIFAASASPAPAQVARDPAARDLEFQNQQLLNQQLIERQRSVAQENQLNTLDARVQSQERLQGLEAARRPTLAPLQSAVQPPALNMGNYATIPDAALAASNARVREASQNKR
ncbi:MULTISPECIES: hypothetical protein [unclassified Phenylobacterium]|uniref:hypothetical protein n=1 Tax=unclassified Phenylobacterium TaxID=2640670 RepID=UPI000700A38E|nr:MULTISPECIES: hypothetical protein [unclassified Phenylobacterium]KQW72982.1 hypothetical protein ASC73_01050 [Phenylobacterium sp. Root1277]